MQNIAHKIVISRRGAPHRTGDSVNVWNLKFRASHFSEGWGNKDYWKMTQTTTTSSFDSVQNLNSILDFIFCTAIGKTFWECSNLIWQILSFWESRKRSSFVIFNNEGVRLGFCLGGSQNRISIKAIVTATETTHFQLRSFRLVGKFSDCWSRIWN